MPGKEFRDCCRTRKGKGPHAGGCRNYEPSAKAVQKQTARKVKDFAPPEGAWVKMQRVEGVWCASLVLLDGRTAEVDVSDWHWALDMLAARIETPTKEPK